MEEINNKSNLLQGIKLGYQMKDSCDYIYNSLDGLFSLVSYSKGVTNEISQTVEFGNMNITS